MAPFGQRAKHVPSRQREVGRQRGPRRSDRLAVPPRIRDHDEDRRQTRVTQLQLDPASLCLRIDEPRFGLHGQRLVGRVEAADELVPRSLVTGDRQSHLGSNDEPRRETRPESAEQGDLDAIGQRHRPRIHVDADVEPDGRAEPCDLVDRCRLEDAAFDPARLSRRHPRGPTDVGQRSTEDRAGAPNLLADLTAVRGREATSTIDRSLARRHTLSLAAGPYLAVARVAVTQVAVVGVAVVRVTGVRVAVVGSRRGGRGRWVAVVRVAVVRIAVVRVAGHGRGVADTRAAVVRAAVSRVAVSRGAVVRSRSCGSRACGSRAAVVGAAVVRAAARGRPSDHPAIERTAEPTSRRSRARSPVGSVSG